MSPRALVVAIAVLAAAAASAQDRPPEDELFGAPPPAAPAPGGGQKEPGPPLPVEDRLGARLAETDDPLRIGGLLYLRATTAAAQHEAASRWTLRSPSFLDLFLDARPNDRVRAFALARTQYDPTLADAAADPVAQAFDALLAEGTAEGLGVVGRSADPTQVVLDQLWLRFDVGRRAFVTLGKQHVKWGVGRFWNPTDFLHAARRDPLATFDLREGTTMARVAVPWETYGASVQAAVILEPLLPAVRDGAPRAGEAGALGFAMRAEAPLGASEWGAGFVVQRGRPARLGLDVSAGVWELDVYGELALRSDAEVPLWRDAGADRPLLERFQPVTRGGPHPSATAGGSWTRRYGDDDTFTVGVEYAFHRDGYDSARVYPWLLLNDVVAGVGLADPRTTTGDFVPLQLGRHYAGAFFALPSPGSWDDASFTLSTLGNLSDASFVTRIDGSLAFLTHLRFEAFGAVHYGTDGGEFRLGIELPTIDVPQVGPLRVVSPPPLFEAGVAIRVAL
jgi:hypothetical protein